MVVGSASRFVLGIETVAGPGPVCCIKDNRSLSVPYIYIYIYSVAVTLIYHCRYAKYIPYHKSLVDIYCTTGLVLI